MSDGPRRGLRRAVALGYQRQADAAPRVVAKGRGALADRLVATAAEHGITVERDADLIACLDCLDVGTEIPEHAFAAVARLLAFLYALNDRAAAER